MKSRSGRTLETKSSLSEWNTAEYLKSYRDALSELMKLSEYTDQEKKHTKKDILFIYNTLKEDVCRKCPRFRACFGGPFGSEGDMEAGLKELIIHTLFYGDSDDDTVIDFCSTCVYNEALKQELSWLSKIWFQNKLWRNQYFSLHTTFTDYLSAQRSMLEECIRQLESAKKLEKHTKRKLNRLLFHGGCLVLDGREWTGSSGGLRVLLEARLLSGWKTDTLSRKVSEVYQSPLSCMMPGEWIPAGRHRILFSEGNNFNVLFGKSHRSKTGETLCGDTFSFFHKKRDQVILCLCDGMGTGERAYLSSSRLIEAFEALMMAGTDEKTALRLLHSVLYLGVERESSTLDITSISLKTGVAGFIKAGGASTFIRRGGKVERIENDSLPPGYLGVQDIGCRYIKLYDGDMIIMLSDGMLSFEGENADTQSMEQLIEGIGTGNAQSFAERLMELIPEAPEGEEDDRTVMVAVISERGKGIHVGRG